MSDDETNLMKWTAFARATDPEAVGHTLNELAKEIARLRRVCRDGSDYACDIRGHTQPKTVVWSMLNNFAADLADAGKEPRDGE